MAKAIPAPKYYERVVLTAPLGITASKAIAMLKLIIIECPGILNRINDVT